jgi:hypothetical protein
MYLVHLFNRTSLIVKTLQGWSILKYPIRNLIFEKISQTGTTTDADLMNALQKEGITLADSDFNKTLMDLEIYGLIRVSWLTKDKRRIELVVDSNPAS